LREVQWQLLFEFPYAVAVIDFVLADLIGLNRVRLQPSLMLGKPGGGKSRFARRLAELLGVGAWRRRARATSGEASFSAPSGRSPMPR
jgi:MoxR-like ATPase